MMSQLLTEKVQSILLFLSSFVTGMAFIESHPVIGNFIGSALITIIIGVIKNHKKNKSK